MEFTKTIYNESTNGGNTCRDEVMAQSMCCNMGISPGIIGSEAAFDFSLVSMDFIEGFDLKQICLALIRTENASMVEAFEKVLYEVKRVLLTAYRMISNWEVDLSNLIMDLNGKFWIVDFKGVHLYPEADISAALTAAEMTLRSQFEGLFSNEADEVPVDLPGKLDSLVEKMVAFPEFQMPEPEPEEEDDEEPEGEGEGVNVSDDKVEGVNSDLPQPGPLNPPDEETFRKENPKLVPFVEQSVIASPHESVPYPPGDELIRSDATIPVTLEKVKELIDTNRGASLLSSMFSGSETEKIDEPETDKVDEPETDKVDEPETDKVDEPETDKVDEPETDNSAVSNTR